MTDYDQITPNQWVAGIVFSLATFALVLYAFNRYVKSLDRPTDEDQKERYIYQYGNTSMAEPLESGMADEKPDIAAVNTGMMPISGYLTEREFIILLAVQKLPDNKYRLTANKIYDIVNGDRNAVLKIIGEVRSPKANYRKLDENMQPVVELESE